jgi:Nuclear pore protein 84 / 107
VRGHRHGRAHDQRELDNLPSSVKGPLPDLAKASLEPAEEAEMLLVRSIEWMVVEVETYDTALEQANVILRYLLRMHSPPLFYFGSLHRASFLCLMPTMRSTLCS